MHKPRCWPVIVPAVYEYKYAIATQRRWSRPASVMLPCSSVANENGARTSTTTVVYTCFVETRGVLPLQGIKTPRPLPCFGVILGTEIFGGILVLVGRNFPVSEREFPMALVHVKRISRMFCNERLVSYLLAQVTRYFNAFYNNSRQT